MENSENIFDEKSPMIKKLKTDEDCINEKISVILLLPHENCQITIIHKIPKEIKVDVGFFEELWNMHPKEKGLVKIYGKEFPTPRWHQSFGKSYYFSGVNHKAQLIENGYLLKILNWVQIHSGKKEYNQILMNWYEDGNQYIGLHSDDERQLEEGFSIYSFSFGQSRDFLVKAKDKSFDKTIQMPDGSLIIMEGSMQKYYYHGVPKRSIKKCPGRRINITVRVFK